MKTILTPKLHALAGGALFALIVAGSAANADILNVSYSGYLTYEAFCSPNA